MVTRNYMMLAVGSPALAACGNADQNTEMPMTTEDMPMADGMSMEPSDMPMMQSEEAGMTASAEGTVRKIDDDAGTITIDHGPVPQVEWPAMTMGFTADSAQRASVT